LAIAQQVDEKIDIRVHPALLPANHALATVADNYNAIYVKGTPVGPLMFYGQGAGGGPTASAIISDIIASANSKFEIRNSTLKKAKVRNINEVKGKFYIRLEVPDRVGVLAGISKVFAQKKVSIAAVLQKESNGQFVTLIILTDKVVEKNLRAALATMKKLSVVHKIGSVIRLIA